MSKNSGNKLRQVRAIVVGHVRDRYGDKYEKLCGCGEKYITRNPESNCCSECANKDISFYDKEAIVIWLK